MLKKLVIAGAIVAAATGSALAQQQPNVEVYGRIDAGILNVQGVGATETSITQVLSSPMYTSNIGFLAKENLGGGLTAFARIESQINPGDGTQGVSSGTGSANAVFGREANLGFESKDWGKVTLGRQVHPIYQYFNAQDVRGGFGFGSSLPFYADGSSFGGTATSKTGIGTITGSTYLSNTLSYETPDFNGLKIRGAYTFGNTAGDVDYNKKMGLAALYDKGMFIGTTGIHESYGSTGLKTGRFWWVGGGVRPINGLTIRGGYTKFENPSISGQANSEFDLKQISAEYKATERVKVFGGVYQLADKVTTADKSRITSIGTSYDFSKRTEVYTAVAWGNNDGNAGFAAYGGGGANVNSLNTAAHPGAMVAGRDHRAIVAGMVHRF